MAVVKKIRTTRGAARGRPGMTGVPKWRGCRAAPPGRARG
jgi:hypothetical protein